MLIPFAARVSAYTIPYETWMGAYVAQKKVGYMSLKIDKGEFNGVKGYRMANVLSNRLTVLGTELTQLVTAVVYTDEKQVPLSEEFAMSSGGKTTRVRATFTPSTVECVVSAGSGSSVKSVPIPQGAKLVADAMFAVDAPPPKIGERQLMHYFNPLTLSIDELDVTAEREEKLTLGGKEYTTIVIKSVTPLGEMTLWQEPDGDVLQVKAMMGITLLRESKQQAIKGIGEGSADDFAVLTSVKPNRPIASPRQCRTLEAVLTGLEDESMRISDSRQKAALIDGNPGKTRFLINGSSFDESRSLVRPLAGAGFEDELASTPYIDYDMPEVAKQAREIVGEERNAYAACSKIREWVHANMKTRTDIGITRSASDVLESKEGVCRDYAILFAALARAAGIPTRIAAGLTYTDGAFYYHAWNECYVGEWVPFDATLAQDFVDATHIKLAQGDATCMYGLARVIGALKIDVKSTK